MIGATMMVALLAFAALAVDVANARNHKRSLQNAADAAALAGARDLPNTTAALSTVKQYVTLNIGTVDWTGCVDAGHLSVTPDGTNQCISFNPASNQVRVRIPIRNVKTFFGGAVGKSAIPVTATATAGAIVSRSGRIVPAAVSGLQGTGLVCIEQSGNNTSCATRERGQFGSLSSPRLNWFFPSSNVQATSLAINYAMNLDHDITSYTSGASTVCDGSILSPCTTSNSTGTATANHILTSTGNDIPPVTEGFVTGFTASTSDFGSMSFCGRLQRPDYSAGNAIDPRPDDCTNPGAPTINVLGKTINGRHIYFWLNDRARQLFYPEVWNLGYSDTDQRLAIGQTIFSAGDKRLDCFLAGYRWDTTNRTETLPDCRSVGLQYPGSGSPFSAYALDTFSAASYSNSNGTAAFGSPWTEVSDDNSPTGGQITVTGGALRIGMSASANGRSIKRTVDMRDPTTGTLASTATLSLFTDGSNANKGQVTLDVSTNGTTWTTLVVGKASNPTPVVLNVTPYISSATRFRFTVTKTGAGSEYLTIDDFRISFSGTVANGSVDQIAPIFKDGIQNDPRWGVIPLVDSWGSSTTAKPIQGFWGFFASTSYVTSQKVAAFDAWVFDPALTLGDPASQTFQFGFAPNQQVRLIH